MDNILKFAHDVFDIEARSIEKLKNQIDAAFTEAVKLIAETKGKVVITGIGKSGLIGRKIAATLTSTGTPAVFLHPVESSHGDMGLLTAGDVVIAISYSGNILDLSHVLNYAARKNIPVISMTGSPKSPLAESAKVNLNIHVSEEACPLNLAPTASSATTLAMGDALAMCVLKVKGFGPEQFAEYHPGGSLGFKLMKVQDLMHQGAALPLVGKNASMKEMVSVMTHKEVRGAAGVVDDSGNLVGIVTDGDIRRRIEKHSDPLSGIATDLMNANPKTIDASEMAERALFVMEQFKIQMLFVVDKSSGQPQKPVGVLHLQDLLKGKVR